VLFLSTGPGALTYTTAPFTQDTVLGGPVDPPDQHRPIYADILQRPIHLPASDFFSYHKVFEA